MKPILEPMLHNLRLKKVAKHIPENCVLADIGCGNGHTLHAYAGKIITGYGFDLHKGEIAIVEPKIKIFPNVDVEKKIPLDSNKIDIVIMLAVIEHLSNPLFVLKECYRILKYGGMLCITTPTPLSKMLIEFLAFKVGWIDKNLIKGHKQYFKKQQLVKLLKLAQFLNIEVGIFEFGLNRFAKAYKE